MTPVETVLIKLVLHSIKIYFTNSKNSEEVNNYDVWYKMTYNMMYGKLENKS